MISSNKIKQVRMKEELYNLGKTEIDHEGINIYDKERMLIDLAGNKNQIGYYWYLKIWNCSKGKIKSKILDRNIIQKYW